MHRDLGGEATDWLDWYAPQEPRLLSWLLSGRAELPADPIAEQSRPERVRVKRHALTVRPGTQARSASRVQWVLAA